MSGLDGGSSVAGGWRADLFLNSSSFDISCFMTVGQYKVDCSGGQTSLEGGGGGAENAGVEIGVEITGPDRRGGKCRSRQRMESRNNKIWPTL